MPMLSACNNYLLRRLCCLVRDKISKLIFSTHLHITTVSMLAVRTLKLTLFGVIHTNYSLSLLFHLCKSNLVTERIYVDEKDIKRRWDY